MSLEQKISLKELFFRNALRTSKELLLDIMVENIDPRTMTLDRITAGKLGAALVGEIQRSITTLQAASEHVQPLSPARAVRRPSWTPDL